MPGLQFQKRSYANVELFRCGKKGHGLRAMENIPSGTFIIEYVGEVCCCLEFKLCVFCDVDRDPKIHIWLVLKDVCHQWITSRDHILRNLRIGPSNEKLSHGMIAWACAMCFILPKEPFCLLVGCLFYLSLCLMCKQLNHRHMKEYEHWSYAIIFHLGAGHAIIWSTAEGICCKSSEAFLLHDSKLQWGEYMALNCEVVCYWLNSFDVFANNGLNYFFKRKEVLQQPEYDEGRLLKSSFYLG